ncbi:helix-turn-helix transcriptional regulator [Calidifontibacter terrae]
MEGRLSVLGVGSAGEALYRQILRAQGQTLATHIGELALGDDEASEALAQLRTHRLVRVADDGGLTADHPRASLERVVSAEEARLATRRQDLARLRDAIDQFVTDHRVGQELSAQTPPLRERVDLAVLASVHEQLAAASVGPIRRTRAVSAAADPRDHATTVSQVEAGRSLRGLYLASVYDAGGDWMREWAALGEEQRIVSHVPSEFVCFGDDAALATTRWGRFEGDWVVLRDPMVVAAFVELFDRMWESAAAAPAGLDQGRDLLSLMQQGLKDEAIARALGVSLRTVRRRVAELMTAYGVETRFQLALKIGDQLP